MFNEFEKSNNINDEIIFERYATYSIDNMCYEQVLRRVEERPTHVQAYINNISVPKSLEELKIFIYEHRLYNIEEVLTEEDTNWTCPKWTVPAIIR